MADPNDIIRSIKRTLNVLVGTTLVLFALVAGVAVTNYKNATENRDALCAFRDNVQSDIDRSERFLRDNPEGIPGIPAKIIQQQIHDQRQTILALSKLDC